MATFTQRVKAFLNPPPQPKNKNMWLLDDYLSSYTGELPSGILQDSKFGYAKAYLAVMAVRQAVDYYAVSALDVPSKIIRNTTGKPEDDEVIAESTDVKPRHVLYEGFKHHRREYGISAISAMIYNIVLYDAIYGYKVEGETKTGKKHVQILNSLGMTVRDELGYISGYDYSWNNSNLMLKPKQVAYTHGFNPFEDFKGASLVQSAISKIRIEDNLDSFLQAFFGNNASLSLVGSPQNNPNNPMMSGLSKEELTQLRKIIDDWHTGVKDSFRPLVTNIPVDWQVLPIPDVDKQYQIGQNIEKEILSAFGVNPALVGNSDDTSYKEDIPQIESQFVNKRLRPVLSITADLINDDILPFVDGSEELRYEYDYSGYQLVTEQDTINLDMRTTQLNSGGMAVNDYIVANGGEPVDEFEDMFIYEGVPVPKEEVPNLWRYKFGVNPFEIESAVSEELGKANKSIKADSNEAIEPAFAYIPLANNPHVIRIQRQLKKMFTDSRIEWQTAPTFHITLCYAGLMSEVAISKCVSLIDPEKLAIQFEPSPIDYFDTPNGKALHLKVVHETAIDAIQADVFSAFMTEGYDISEYSEPANWDPHITLAYIPNDIDVNLSMLNNDDIKWLLDINIPSDQIIIGRDSYDPSVIITAPDYVKHADNIFDTKALDLDAIFTELAIWRRKAEKGKPFTPVKSIGYLADMVGESDTELSGVNAAMDYLKAFQRRIAHDYNGDNTQKTWLQSKSIQSTRIDFEIAVEDAISDALQNTIDQKTFILRMMQAIRGYGDIAMLDGLAAGGVVTTINNIDDDDRIFLNRHYVRQRGFVNDLAKVVFGKGLSESEQSRKPILWFNKSIAPLFEAGKASADKNGMYEWVLGNTEEHCRDCVKLDGQRHRMKTYYAKGIIPQSDVLECGGWHCDCRLVKVFGSARGRLHTPVNA